MDGLTGDGIAFLVEVIVCVVAIVICEVCRWRSDRDMHELRIRLAEHIGRTAAERKERRMREESTRFEANAALAETPVEERGKRCARYLLDIIEEQAAAGQ